MLDLPVPVPEDDEILVRIMAAAVNPLDNMIIRGELWEMNFPEWLKRPERE